MNDVLSVAMVQSLEQLSHVSGCSCLCKSLVLLLSDLVEKRLSGNVLHHQVDVLLIVVCFVVLDDVRVVKLVKDADFFHDAVDVGAKLLFVEDFDSNLEVLVMLIRSQEDAAEGTNTEDFSL